MSTPILRFFNDLASDFISDRLDVVAAQFVYPLPLYAGDKLQVFGGAEVYVEAISMYREAVRDAGITQIVPRIIAPGLVVRNISGVWVEWDHCDRDGRVVRISQVRYYLSHKGAQVPAKIEMVEYTMTAFPEVTAQYPLRATA